MYSCVIYLQVPRQRMGEAVRLWRESVLPEVKEHPGWKDAAFVVNDAGTEIRIFTLWENEAQAQAFAQGPVYRELTKLIALSSRYEHSVERVGDEPEFLEKLKPFVSKN